MTRVKKEFINFRNYLTEFLDADATECNLTREEKIKIYEPLLMFVYNKVHVTPNKIKNHR